ncbi:MAG: hypothetical protein LBG13_03425 [Holosporales bacterium]|jgi:hypothetical protein|nr:hypothetical protein [Holosporales bacterium]
MEFVRRYVGGGRVVGMCVFVVVAFVYCLVGAVETSAARVIIPVNPAISGAQIIRQKTPAIHQGASGSEHIPGLEPAGQFVDSTGANTKRTGDDLQGNEQFAWQQQPQGTRVGTGKTPARATGDSMDKTINEIKEIEERLSLLKKQVEEYNRKQKKIRSAFAHLNSIIAQIPTVDEANPKASDNTGSGDSSKKPAENVEQQRTGETSQSNVIDTSQGNGDMFQNNEDTSQSNVIDTFQNNGNMFQNNEGTSQNNVIDPFQSNVIDSSQNNGDMFQNNGGALQSNGGASQGNVQGNAPPSQVLFPSEVPPPLGNAGQQQAIVPDGTAVQTTQTPQTTQGGLPQVGQQSGGAVSDPNSGMLQAVAEGPPAVVAQVSPQ